MKRILFLQLAIIICFGNLIYAQTNSKTVSKTDSKTVAQPPELQWHTDLMEAYNISEETNKPIFGFFTGSDWCGWCHKLESDCFSKPEFKKWAAENVVLLELDFPKRKTLSPELIKQNNDLRQIFQVPGYPTIWLFTMIKSDVDNQYNFNPIGKAGYPRAEPGKEVEMFIGQLNQILADDKKKDK